MGAKFARGTLQDMTNALRNTAVSAVPELREQMEFIAEQGAQDMQQRIRENHDAPYSQYRYDILQRGRSAGREDTGKMLDAVEYRVTTPVPGVVNAEAGWLDEYLKYFGYQEKGTEYIPAMHAIRDAGDAMRDRVQQAAHDLIQNVAKKRGR